MICNCQVLHAEAGPTFTLFEATDLCLLCVCMLFSQDVIFYTFMLDVRTRYANAASIPLFVLPMRASGIVAGVQVQRATWCITILPSSLIASCSFQALQTHWSITPALRLVPGAYQYQRVQLPSNATVHVHTQ
jgi:hypothetical protein